MLEDRGWVKKMATNFLHINKIDVSYGSFKMDVPLHYDDMPFCPSPDKKSTGGPDCSILLS